ncbi:sugar phosphate isomerase/epimerase [Pedobacter africanus]|uniref:Sugar phosphate isomerase/epimerase n=1 Tax=Pedobacter africanus TaxID=151894 RepID=A0ACC6KZ27_9SPHI|nr:TIM barrel protein [Pedobacter africanus]MDR6784427.1 sugar phosphate isomerase/epimerase [Pedobacter africanus]
MRINLQLLILLVLLLFSETAGARQQPKRLKLGYSIAITAITPEKMAYARSAGIDYIEVSMNPLVGKNREFKLTDVQLLARAKQAKKAANDAGIRIWSVHMPYAKDVDLSLLKEEERLQVVALHQKVLTYCKILQPEIVLFHPSYYLGLNEREMRIKQLVKSVATLNLTVKQIGSTMVVENMLGFELLADAKRERPLCRTVEETSQIMDLLPVDVYSAIDMNHIKHPENLILAMGKRLRSVHIADGTGKQENHYFPCSGQGQNNWVAILKALDQVGYTGPFMYESAYKDVKDMKPCYESLYQNLLQSDKTDSILIAKNFPLLLQLEKNGPAGKALLKNKQIQKILTAQRKRVQQAIHSCKMASCYAEAIKWDRKEINEIGNELIRLKIKGLDRDTVVLRKSWNNCALAINRIFDVYISSKAPRYPKIDSISFKRGDSLFLAQVQQLLKHKIAGDKQLAFFELPLRGAIDILKLNGRDEAARYEPLNSGLNAAPFRKAGLTDWKAFKYSMILVPGLGPEVPGMALDPNGAKRCEAAVLRYKQGLAPFIVVSGGQVHPFRTPFNEAVEMKKYLVEKLGIPEDVVFIEPHARHTTTNIRNASRMIFRFGMPADKPVLIVTDTSQSKYIVERMGKTAMRDLGYLPYKDLAALGPEDTVFYPVAQSQEPDPFDPLDP